MSLFLSSFSIINLNKEQFIMAKPSATSMTMRIIHRYLGFFLVGIMAVYATSGIVLIFRDTDFLKQEHRFDKQLAPNLSPEDLGQALDLRKLKVDKTEAGIYYFQEGTYDSATGAASYTLKELPTVLEKMTHLHKAKSSEPLFFLNIFFGLSLLFFVISSFWMFMPKTEVFKKGLYFTLGGIVLTLILLFV
jgi:uncharacterized iron-regulated membrane protein